MSSIAVTVDGLGKEYAYGDRGAFRYEALRDALSETAAGLLRRVREGAARPQEARTFWALKDVSFEVPRGQVVGIIGRNGAGKSTLLKVLSRITLPTLGGADIHGRVGSLLEVGTGFHPELTGRENIYLNGAILGMRRTEVQRNFDAIVAFSGVEKFLDTPVKRYSSGMYVRLAFAVAAHLETEILFVDEVLAVGDAEFQRKCLDKMQNVVRDGRTILFVSHNMAAVKSLCQRAILIDGGRMVRDGSVDEVVDAYLSTGRGASEDGLVGDVPRSGTGEARLRQIRLRDQGIDAVSQIYLGDPFSVEMTFDVREPLRDVVLGVGFSSLDGVRFATAYNVDGGRPGWDFEPGLHRVVFDVDVVLLPRRYTLDIVMTRSGGNDIDYVQQVFDFTAVGVARSGLDRHRWQTVHGYVRPKGEWHQPERVAEIGGAS
ncbi:MAG TPA: ABC transporter ATP-binding protein [Vicinamibacterales bacterium]|nr:ABC transporter ATP-binding protein [Vicinamibacterales bacterium]